MIKKLVIVFFMLLLNLSFYETNALEKHRSIDNMKYVIIDGVFISQKSIAMIDARQQLEKIMLYYQLESKKIQKTLQKKLDLLEKQANILQIEELNKKKDIFDLEIRHKQKTLHIKRQNFEELQVRIEEIFSNKIRDIIMDFDKRKKIAIVLDKGSIFYCSDKLDISEIVIEELNSKFKKINLNIYRKK